MGIPIDFEWARAVDGYEIRTISPGEFTWDVAKERVDAIFPRSDRFQKFRPLDENPHLFQRLATLHGKPKQYRVEFANEYGLLQLCEPLPGLPLFEQVSMWDAPIRMMHRAYENRNSPTYLRALENVQSNLRVGLARVPKQERLQIKITPGDLFGAIWVQFLAFITTGRDIRVCEECGITPVEVGGRGKERRFCSRKCSDAHHNRRKMEAQK